MIPPRPTASSTAFATRTLETFARLRDRAWLRATALFFYYLGIIVALIFIYGKGDFSTAPFVYQGF